MTVQRDAQLFERALARSGPDPGWRRLVGRRLVDLQRAFVEYVALTEGPDGLYASVLDDAPRLARRVGALTEEHTNFVATMTGLRQRIEAPGVPAAELRGWGQRLLRDLYRHRQRGADLIHEAYQTDLGGET